ncbi:MAG: alpha/beta fold hydrolase [Devosiaceae bacterium]
MSVSSLFDGFEHGSLPVSGEIDIAYVTAGSGPPVLLLHGYPQSKAMWAHVAPTLAKHFTVVAADLRGYGASSKPPNASDHSTYSFRAMAQDQLSLMQSLGHDHFHAVGHDRGGRTAHRMALDHPQAVQSLTVMDIIPTSDVFGLTDKTMAMTYWHWFFLAQPAPFPQTMINANPDLFFETCLLGWGKSNLTDFDPDQLADYRASWHNPQMVHASCSDYRAASTIDSAHDAADSDVKVTCPTLVLYGGDGVMAERFDMAALWQAKCEDVTSVAIPGGHFFVDQHPAETAQRLISFF